MAERVCGGLKEGKRMEPKETKEGKRKETSNPQPRAAGLHLLLSLLVVSFGY
jgi:hypothetical protein